MNHKIWGNGQTKERNSMFLKKYPIILSLILGISNVYVDVNCGKTGFLSIYCSILMGYIVIMEFF